MAYINLSAVRASDYKHGPAIKTNGKTSEECYAEYMEARKNNTLATLDVEVREMAKAYARKNGKVILK